MTYAAQLKRIIRQLERSPGRRIARRNALRDLDTFLRGVRRDLRKQYPSIGKDGQEIRRELLPKGERRCPADGTYVATAGEFAAHVVEKHHGKCWCGFEPQVLRRRTLHGVGATKLLLSDKRKAASGLRGHFNRVKDQLTAHVTVGAVGGMNDGETNTA